MPTYLLWVDCSAITHDTDALCDYLKREHKVMFSAGSEYGGNGHDFVRINVACPRARMIEGLARFIGRVCSRIEPQSCFQRWTDKPLD